MEETVVRQAFVTSGKYRQERILIGRGADCDVVLEGTDLSRHHSEIACKGGKALLKDLGSTNGTFRNGARITAEEELATGDVIGLGSHLIVATLGPEQGGKPEVSLDWGKDAVPGGKKAAGPPPARLVVRTPDGRSLEFTIDKDEVTVGRTIENDFRIDDTTVSRHHARLRREGKGFVVEDLGSSNGTSVGGKKITGPTKVAPGAAIAFGAVGGRIVTGKGKVALPKSRLLLIVLVAVAVIIGIAVFASGGEEEGLGFKDLYNRGYVTKLIGVAETQLGEMSESDKMVFEVAQKTVAASQAAKDEKWPLALELGEEALRLAKEAGVRTVYAEKVVAEAKAAIEAFEADKEGRFASAMEEARVALASGNLDLAEGRSKDALSIKPDSADAAALLAQVTARKQEQRAATVERAKADYESGLAAYREGRGDDALRLLNEAATLASGVEEVSLASSAAELSGKADKVITAFKEAVSQEALGDLAAAVGAYRQVIDVAADPEVAYWKQATEAVARLAAQISQEVVAKAAQAQQLFDEGRKAEAYQLCEELLKLQPGDKKIISLRAAMDYEIEQNYKKGYWFYKEGDFDKAAEFFKSVIGLAPESHVRYNDAAEFLGKMGYPIK